MAYLGTPIDTRNQFQSLQGKRFNGDGSTTAFTLDVAPSSTLDIEVFVGNVRQDPNSAYTLSGTTLTFTGAPPSGTNNIYVVHQAKAVGTIGIPDDTISARTLVTADGDNDHILIHDATDGELKKALVPSSTADGFFATSGLSSKDLGTGLHIKTADSSASVATDSDELVIEGSGASGLSILSGNTSNGKIAFNDDGGNSRGAVIYEHNGDNLRFQTAATDAFKIDSAGHVTQPLQPSFMLSQTGALTVANGHTIFSTNTTERWDVNSDVSGATFTAPVTGKYFLNYNVLFESVTSDSAFEARIDTSNRNYSFMRNSRAYVGGGTTYVYNGGCVIADMDANDTSIITHVGPTAAVHVSAAWSWFQGYLLG